MTLPGILFLLGLSSLVSGKVPDWLVQDISQETRCTANGQTLLLTNGLIAREFYIAPDFFTSDFYSYEKESSLLRAVVPEAVIGLDGIVYEIGGVLTDTPRAYLNRSHLMNNIALNPNAFHYQGYSIMDPIAPVRYTPRRHAPSDIVWPPNGVRLEIKFTAPPTAIPAHQNITVTVVYEMYDAVPIIAKWVNISPASKSTVEASIYSVEYLAINQQWAPSDDNWLVTDTDVAHSSVVAWGTDPSASSMPGSFEPIVNCSYSNTFSIPLMQPFESFRVRHLVIGSGDKERQGLAKRRLTRMLAPWTQESPIFFHMTKFPTVTPYDVIDQLAEVGFEMLIYSFGSGFNIESTDEAYINEIANVVSYAKQKGIEVGGYDLIALSRVAPKGYEQFQATDPETGE